MNVNYATCQYYTTIFSELRAKGILIPSNDMWIAAQAIENDLTLVTFDQHFKGITGLKLLLCNENE